MATERSDLELVWPAHLFIQEARALVDAGHTSESTLGFLLAEAFHDDRGLRLFQEVHAASPRNYLDDPWGLPVENQVANQLHHECERVLDRKAPGVAQAAAG